MKNKLRIWIMLLLLCNSAFGTAYDCYVDTGSSGGDGTTNGVSGATAAFATLSAAETAWDGVLGSGDTLNIHLNRTNGGGEDTTAVTFDGWTAGSLPTITQDDFPTGGYDGTKYVLHSTNATALVLQEVVSINKMQIKVTETSTSTARGISVYNTSGIPNGSTLTFNRLIIQGDCSGTGEVDGIYAIDADSTINLTNSLIKDIYILGDTDFRGLDITSQQYFNVYNSIITNCNRAVNQSSTSDITIVNSIIFNNVDDFYGTVDCNYCASDDADATVYANGINWNNTSTDWNANFTDYANGDFTVKNTDASIYHSGKDLDLALDLAGNSWHATTPSIGAFEYQAESPPALTGNSPRIYIIN